MPKNPQSGSALMAALVVLLILALIAAGSLAWLSRDRIGGLLVREAPKPVESQPVVQDVTPAPPEPEPEPEPEPALEPEPVETQAPAAPPAPETVRPGNPVVARMGGQEIRRVEVLEFIENLPSDLRKDKSAMELFPDVLAEMVDSMVVDARVADSAVARDPQVAEQLEAARARIERSVYLQGQVAARLTEEKLRAAYDAYAARAPGVEEIRARHILVPTQEEAQDIVKQLDAGRSFEALAMAHSVDGSGAQGGDLGYFTPQEVVPAFGQATVALPLGAYTKEPVETQFGWHVIQVEDRRPRALPSFAALRPQIEETLQREILGELLSGWRAQADAHIYGINGPAAGAETDMHALSPVPLGSLPTLSSGGPEAGPADPGSVLTPPPVAPVPDGVAAGVEEKQEQPFLPYQGGQ